MSRMDWFSFMDFPVYFKIPNEAMTCIRWIFLQGVWRAQRNRIGEQIGFALWLCAMYIQGCLE